jgi:uncharacterized protein (TIGR03437 family)
MAQTQIGGGTCSSSTLNGTYAVAITGRQVNSSGSFVNVVQANGSATFDGLSAITIVLAENTNQALAAPLNWSGTYSVQANCAAVANITTGGSATLNIMIYDQGHDFLLTGSDAAYSYAGSGVPQSSSCSVATLDGPYTLNASGFQTSGNTVGGTLNATGLVQFDGQGNITASTTAASAGPSTTTNNLTGTYTVNSDCLGTAMLTDSSSTSYAMSFSIYGVASSNTSFYATLGSSQMLLAGDGHIPSGQAATCSVSDLNGAYGFTLTGRAISSSGSFAGSFQSVGTAAFDGNGNVTLTGTSNTNAATGTPFSYTGTYSVDSDCSGALSTTINGAATFNLVVWNGGANFGMTGADGTYAYAASGTGTLPPACADATVSGEYTFTASGFTLSGTSQIGAQDEGGVLQFDGQGNVTASYIDTQGGMTPVSVMSAGTYTVASDCTASATLTDSSGNGTALNLVVEGAHGEGLAMLASDSQFVRTGGAHSAFLNPSQSIGNVASYAYSSTPPGSVFVLFGLNLASRPAGAVTTNLPTQLLNTSVTVNGELAPLFYADPGQIDAQLPWDIPGNTVASVIVTNGTSISNAAAIYVPATGTPGINTRGAIVNQDGSVNSGASQANVGDEVVVYFTGGGPVQASGTLTTGEPSPAGLSAVTGSYTVTVGGVQANVIYVGLTPGSIGLYQANFNVPQIAKGDYPVVITIAGTPSNAPVIAVAN